LQYDPKGYFVISLDRDEEQIVLRHYLPDHTAAHEMRGRVAESMLLGLLREGLVSQLSHAAYLGAELAKAEAALHLELRYRQDRPLQAMAQPSGESDGSAEPATAPAGPMPRISPPLTLAQLRAAREGDTVDVVLEATGQPIPGELVGTALEPNEKAPFNSFHRTDEQIAVHWTDGDRHGRAGGRRGRRDLSCPWSAALSDAHRCLTDRRSDQGRRDRIACPDTVNHPALQQWPRSSERSTWWIPSRETF
jgi:hypothetical protein